MRGATEAAWRGSAHGSARTLSPSLKGNLMNVDMLYKTNGMIPVALRAVKRVAARANRCPGGPLAVRRRIVLDGIAGRYHPVDVYTCKDEMASSWCG